MSSLSFLSFLVSAIIAELKQDDLITSEESAKMHSITDVVTVQIGKSPEVLSKTAAVLQRYGFEEESRLLAGRQSRPSSICLCTVKSPYDDCMPCDIHYCSLIGGVLN